MGTRSFAPFRHVRILTEDMLHLALSIAAAEALEEPCSSVGNTMIGTRNSARGLGLTCVVLASGCSPYLYKDEIQAFDQHTKALAATIDEARSATAIDYRRRVGFQQVVNNQQPRIKLGEDCIDLADQAKSVTHNPVIDTPNISNNSGNAGANNAGANNVVAGKDFECPVVIVNRVTGVEDPLDTEPLPEAFAKADEIAKALDAYAKALLAITNADDRKALDAASGKFCTAVGMLAATPVPAAGNAADAVCMAVMNAYAAFLDRRRYEVLRAGVVEADREVMPGLTTYLEALLQQARNGRIGAIASVADDAGLALDEGRHASRAPGTNGLVYTDSYWVPLNRVFASAKDLEQLLTLDPAAVVKSFAGAHTALADAVASGKGQTEAVFQALEVLSEQIQALRKAFEPAAG